MKVICTTEEPMKSKKDGDLCPRPTGIKKDAIYTVTETIADDFGNTGYILLEAHNANDRKGAYNSKRFAPIQTNYADATAEILEKFKQTDEQPDKIIVPEKTTA